MLIHLLPVFFSQDPVFQIHTIEVKIVFHFILEDIYILTDLWK